MRLRLLLCLLWLIAVGGCGAGSEVARPAPTVQSVPVARPGLPGSDVPRVAIPLSVANLTACRTFDDQQLAQSNVDPKSARERPVQYESACSWVSTDGTFDLAVTLATDRGLSETYALRDTFPVFQPEVVGGYPVVRTSAVGGIACDLWIGISDSQLVVVSTGGLGGRDDDWCELARSFARLVIAALSKE